MFIIKNKPLGDERIVNIDGFSRGMHHTPRQVESTNGMDQKTSIQPFEPLSSSTATADSLTNSNLKQQLKNRKKRIFVANKIVLMAKRRKWNVTTDSTATNEQNALTHIVNQMSAKIMVKLDQINLKVNQINDRLYELEQKLETVEYPF